MDYTDTRIAKLREYLFGIINEVAENEVNQINVDMLSNKANDYSLDKMPMASEVEKWIMGIEIHRDVYSFRSRKEYSQDTINNLRNIGFFEKFEQKIKEKNEAKELPDIDYIEEIKCLNCGTMNSADTNKAVFDIQIQIKYRINKNKKNIVSL